MPVLPALRVSRLTGPGSSTRGVRRLTANTQVDLVSLLTPGCADQARSVSRLTPAGQSPDQEAGTFLFGSMNGTVAVTPARGPSSACTSRCVPGRGQRDRHPHVSDVLLQARRPARVGDVPDDASPHATPASAASAGRRARPRSRCRRASAKGLRALILFRAFLAHEVGLLVQVDHPRCTPCRPRTGSCRTRCRSRTRGCRPRCDGCGQRPGHVQVVVLARASSTVFQSFTPFFGTRRTGRSRSPGSLV